MLLIMSVASIGSAAGQIPETLVTVGDRFYERAGDQYYGYRNGERTDRVDISRIIVRRHNRSVVRLEEHGLDDWGTVDPTPFGDSYHLIRASRTINPIDLARQLYSSGDFEYVAFSALGRLESGSTDPFLSNQEHLQSDQTDGISALPINPGSKEIVVAVIDSGLDFAHPDLSSEATSNLWQNVHGTSNEDYDNDGKVLQYDVASGTWVFDPDDINEVDDDGNGCIDDFIGCDFTAEEWDGDLTPYSTHGTEAAGIIGARTQNGRGIAGIAGGWHHTQGVSIMPLRADFSANEVDAAAVASAIDYACAMGADIISMSWSYTDEYEEIESAMNGCSSHVVMVAASGNSGYSPHPSLAFRWPARDSRTIAVGAILENGTVWFNSGHEVDCCDELDLVAPGGDNWIYTLDYSGTTGESTGDYTYMNGTSASAPQVAATAALIRSINPSFTESQVRSIIRNTADESVIPGGGDHHSHYGDGRLNVYDAVIEAIEQTESAGKAILVDSDVTWSGTQTISGKDIYVLADATLTISGELTLDIGGTGRKSNIHLVGKLRGSGSNPKIVLEDGSEIFNRSSHANAIDGLAIEITDNNSCLYVGPGSSARLDDLEITSGAFLAGSGTIEIADGGNLTYTSGKDFQLNGATILLGEDSRILLDPPDALSLRNVTVAKAGSERWDKIAILGDDIALSDIDISGGDYGLYVQGTDIEVTRAKIHDNYYGIRSHYDYDQWGQNSELTVTDSEIYENDMYGMLLNYVDATIQENLIYDNGSYGVYASTAYLTDTWENEIYGNTRGLHYYNSTTDQDASFYHNYVHDNSQYGIYVSTNSTVYAFDGSSNISGNGSYEIYVGSSSGRFYPSLGPPVDISGFHDIYNTPGTGGYVIKHVVPGWVMPAADNYWGTSSPHSGLFSGGVTYTPYLASSPATGPGGNYRILAAEDEVRAGEWAPRAVAPTIERNVAETNSAGDRKDDLKQSIVTLRDELLASAGLNDVDNEARIVQLYEYLLLDPTDETGERATSVAAIANLASDFVGADLQTRSGVDAVRRVGEAAVVIRTMELLRSRDFEAALAVIPGYVGAAVSLQSVSELHALRAVAKEELGDLEGAIESLEAAQLAYSRDADVDFADQIAVLTESMELRATRSTQSAQPGLAPVNQNENATILEPLSFTVYPNPAGEHAEFRAVGLPEGTLRLTVYDVTGRVVERRSYEVDASGRIRGGLSMGRWAAGLYFARIEAADGTSANAKLVKQ